MLTDASFMKEPFARVRRKQNEHSKATVWSQSLELLDIVRFNQ
ncbi:UNVERIFIED_ORG: hypothetical protein QOE_3402 [Clostridioides difficile F501]